MFRVFKKQFFIRNISTTSRKFELEVPSSKPIKDTEKIDEDKRKLQWRTPPQEKTGEWYSKLKLFAPEDDKNAMFVTAIQQMDMRPSALKKWWKKKNEKQERFLQQFIPERHEMLGNDLAAAHFLVHRGGSVRFYGEENWTKMDKDEKYNLPGKFIPSMVVEAIRCDNMELYYEGLENLRRLKYLKYLSFKNVEPFDDWCLDRVAGSEFEALETLDLSGTNITERGLQALYKIPSLKTLTLDNPYRNKAWELVLAMLEEINPKLKIVDSRNSQ